MTANLFTALVHANLIQFGRFQQDDGSFAPMSFNFLLLPSFPSLMQQTARAFAPILQSLEVDRLLALRHTTALGAALAIESGLPLTYEFGEQRGVSNAFIIEGAYDVGHPTALLTDILSDDLSIFAPAASVGLNITDVLCLFDLRAAASTPYRIHTLFDLETALQSMVDSRHLPAAMKTHVIQWSQNQHEP